jgi:hypothetical protein
MSGDAGVLRRPAAPARLTVPQWVSRPATWLLLCVLVGYGVGLVAFSVQLNDFTMRLADFLNHIELARRLAAGKIEVNGFYPVGYPLALVAAFQLIGDIFVAGKVLSGVAAVAAIAAVYFCVATLLGRDEWPLALLAAVTAGLSPVFLQYATTPGTDMPHVALMLLSVLGVLRAVGSPHPERWLVFAGLAGGASYLVRYTSSLLLASLVLWMIFWKPFPGRLRHMVVAYALAFGIAAAPQLVLSVLHHGTPFYTTTLAKNVWVGIYGGPQPEPIWGRVADAVSLESVISFDLWRFLASWAVNATQPVIVNDVADISALLISLVTGWTSPVPLTVAAAGVLPKMLKALAIVGMVLLALRGDGSRETEARGGFLLLFTVLFVSATAMAFITDRHLLVAAPLLTIGGFGALGVLGTPRGAVAIGSLAVVLLSLHLVASDYPTRWMIGFDHGRQATERLRPFAPRAGEVMSSNWVFYDYDSPWRAKYVHIPVYVDSVPTLISDMRRRGARYVVFDRNAGRAEWPGLLPLLNVEQPPAGLRPIGPAIYSREWPPNEIVVYQLAD